MDRPTKYEQMRRIKVTEYERMRRIKLARRKEIRTVFTYEELTTGTYIEWHKEPEFYSWRDKEIICAGRRTDPSALVHSLVIYAEDGFTEIPFSTSWVRENQYKYQE